MAWAADVIEPEHSEFRELFHLRESPVPDSRFDVAGEVVYGPALTMAHRFITTAEALKEEYKGRTNYWLTRPGVADARDLQLCRAVIPPEEGHPFHTHPELEEIIYVLEGEVEQWVERERRILKPGEVAHIPRGLVHATFNAGRTDAVILAILSPASCEGPFAVDVSGEEPWRSLRPKPGH